MLKNPELDLAWECIEKQTVQFFYTQFINIGIFILKYELSKHF